MPLEKNLWAWLRDQTKPLVAAKILHMERIENSLRGGYPDVEGCYDSYGFHIELKVADRPKRATTRVAVKFQKKQKPWLRRRWAVGGSCWVLLQVGSAHQAKRYLISGYDCTQIGKVDESTLEELSVIEPNDSGIQIIQSAIRYLYDG